VAERVALDFAIAAASQPNDVTDELFEKMKRHWSEGQIVEIAATVALFGFLNRWNDTMATPLEEEPIEVGERGGEVGRRHAAVEVLARARRPAHHQRSSTPSAAKPGPRPIMSPQSPGTGWSRRKRRSRTNRIVADDMLPCSRSTARA